ncbi:MAG: hypothetical protein F4107_01365 [Gemmatimonadetes bacterium]|nr:hypothetical protein [Gemmatimonadota bacterium]MYD12502.1 hypothetical protein [Gemmatimonadota bacterium]MYI64575.1 hypothetical protein [Gemmatimonadota bacterium]
MDWWQTAGLMATLVLTGTAVATFGWRVLRQETDKLRSETESLREESRNAHARIGGEIVQLGSDLRGEISRLREDQDAALGRVRDELRGEMAQLRDGQASLRDGQASLREGLGEVRGELRGLTHSMLALREDFRAHVLAGAD